MKAIFTAVVISFLCFDTSSWAEIRVGAVGPLTGQHASLGAQVKMGAIRAIKDINDNGGLNGEKLVLFLGDDACDPKQAVAVANDMVSKKVALVIGHFCSGSTIPASSVYAEEDVIQITPASSSPKYTDERAGPGTYRICGRDDQQGQIAGQFIMQHLFDANVAIVHDKTAYGKGLANEVKKYINDGGKKEIFLESYTAGEKDYTAFVSKLRHKNIDVLYLGGYHTEAGLIMRQMREQNMKTLLLAGDALLTEEYWRITGDKGNGTLMTFLPDPRKKPQAAEILERFRSNGQEPKGFSLYTYAAIQVWAQAVIKANSTEFKKVNAILSTNTFDTILGDIAFDEKGDVKNLNYILYEWRDRKHREYTHTP